MCWTNWIATCRRMKSNLYLSPCIKLNSKWFKNFNLIRPDPLTPEEEKVKKTHELVGSGRNLDKILIDSH